MKPQYRFLIQDARFLAEDEYTQDRSICFSICSSLKEAQEERKDYGDDCVIVRYEVDPDWKLLINEQIMPN